MLRLLQTREPLTMTADSFSEEMPVNQSKLIVLAVAMGLGSATAFAGAMEDTALTTRVKAALVANPSTKAHQVDVTSKDGVVQLKGYVDDSTGINAAGSVVSSVQGVTKVENNLQVKTSERTAGVVIDDALITTKVKSSLLADSGTHGLKIDVDTRKGVVQLNGFVASETEKTLAQNLAAKVEGVSSVENKLSVRP
jgi:hyperosmotically inducible periplasmic protein